MTSSVQQRLEAWREVARSGRPEWLAAGTPRIVALLEAELALAAIEARRVETPDKGEA